MRYRLVKVFVWQDRLPKNVVDVGGDLQASLVLAHPKYGGSIAGKPSDRDPPSKFIFGDGSSIQFVRLALPEIVDDASADAGKLSLGEGVQSELPGSPRKGILAVEAVFVDRGRTG